MTPEFLRLVCRYLNAVENDSASPETDYRSVYLYNDGPGNRKQVTLGRGFTQFGGSLGMVLRRYIAKYGASSPLFQDALATRFSSASLALDTRFVAALKGASTEQAMREAQNEVFDEVYLAPALRWAADRQFVLPLSNAVIVDSFLHSGGILDFLMKRFPESKPVAGGNEQSWIKAYVRTRHEWLTSKGKPLSNTTYRMEFFEQQIIHGNWAFDPAISPLIANGTNIA